MQRPVWMECHVYIGEGKLIRWAKTRSWRKVTRIHHLILSWRETKLDPSLEKYLAARFHLGIKIKKIFLIPDEFFVLLIRVPSLPQLLVSSKMSLYSTTGSNFFYCFIIDFLHPPSMHFIIKAIDVHGKNYPKKYKMYSTNIY